MAKRTRTLYIKPAPPITGTKHLGRILPLARLDGITVANNYTNAIHSVDRGFPGARPLETISTDIGHGIARMIVILREDRPKGRIVLHSSIAFALGDDDPASLNWALGIVAHELMLVAMIEYMEQSLPGVLLQPIESDFQGWLYRGVDPALHGYVAAHFSAPFSDAEDTIARYRELLVRTLDNLKESVEPARLAYRYDGDLDKLLNAAMPSVGLVLQFAAELLGSCSSEERSPLDDEGTLAAALERLNLSHWLAAYGRDLEGFRRRLWHWESLDEFLAFNRHVERLLWAVGMFPWDGPEGIRVEVPLITDAAELMKAQGGV